MKYVLLAIWLLCLGACTENVKQQEVTVGGPDDPIQVEILADRAYDEKNWAVSEENYRKMAIALPVEAKPWFRLGNIFAHTDRPDDAIRAYREALVRRPDFTKAWHNMGVVQVKQAARTFNDLTIYADPDSPLYNKSERIYQGLMDLLTIDQDTN